MSSATEKELLKIHRALANCRACKNMIGPPVFGAAVASKILLIGQAPGVHEGPRGKPFAHTAGKTLFKWLGEASGANEEELRELIYFAAVARCFPGKAAKGSGDRVPSSEEIRNCARHLRAEIQILKPKLILAVGKIAIAEVFAAANPKTPPTLNEVVGRKFTLEFHGHSCDVVPLPHPSGVSRWPQTEPGKTKLALAIKLLRKEFTKIL